LSNGVECMHFVRNHFCKIGAPKQCIHSRNKSFLSFYITKVFKLLESNPNHHFLQWSRMDAFSVKPFSQLRYPEILHSGPKHKFCIFSHAEGLQSAPNHSQT
jgi:hypothetical protein